MGEQTIPDPIGGIDVILGDVEPNPLSVRQGRFGPDYFKVHWAAFRFASSTV